MTSTSIDLRQLVQGPLEQLATGFGFTEGPLWHPREGCLLFSDMPQDVRRRWSPAVGVDEAMRPANKCNGMTFDAHLNLLVCEHATSSVVRESVDGTRKIVASHWDGKELNSPNDIVLDREGSVYFTDPIYGRLPDDGIERDQDLDFQGVYRVRPDGDLELIVDDFDQPNGLCFSPDYSLLYINDTPRCHIRVFDVGTDGTLSSGRVFRDGIGRGVVGPTGLSDEGVPDGMKSDQHGNVYCTGPDGIWVLSPDGRMVGVIEVPEIVGNLNWGDGDFKTLYITATTSLYRLRMRVRGHREPYMQSNETPTRLDEAVDEGGATIGSPRIPSAKGEISRQRSSGT